MTVSIPKPNWPGLRAARERVAQRLVGRDDATGASAGKSTDDQSPQAREWAAVMSNTAPATAASAAPRAVASAQPVPSTKPASAARVEREFNTTWVLPVMLLVVCLVATGWLFAHGTSAAIWLIALIAVILAGVPIALVLLRVFGYDDSD